MRKALLIILFFAVTGLVTAQEQGPVNAQYGGPQDGNGSGVPTGGPGVAHLSLIHGDVSMQRGDSGDWVATSLNTPLVNGDAVATSAGARAEIQLDYADVLRLAGQSQAKITDLTSSHIQVQVGQGFTSLSMFQGGNAEIEIDTPNVAIRPTKNGRYTIEVNSDSETVVVVRDGEAEVSTSQGSTTVREGELINVRGTDDPEYKVSEAPGPDEWDRWNNDRDNLIRNAEGVRRTNPYYTGTQDLDSYGHWQNVPNYGDVWAPNDQPVNWAPYQVGRWVWEPYYGWTWVSYEPWGWAPYHYGRWFFYGSSWYWWPGAVTPFYQPIWAPALVGFVGFGPHIGFGFGFGTIGWFPLGPFEVFHPWWGFGFNRFGVVGAFDRPFGARGFSTLNVALTNARVRGGITTVAAGNFGRGPAGFGHGVDVGTLRGAHLANGNLGIVPSRESLAPTNRGFRSAPAGIRNTASTHFAGRSRGSGSFPSFHDQAARMQEAARAHGGGEGQFGSRGQFGSDNRSGRNGGFSSQAPAGRFDRSTTGGRTFDGNQRGMQNPGGNRDGFHGFSGSPSRGGTVENRGASGFPQGGGSRQQLDMSKRIVVPRGGNYGARSGGSTYNVYNGGRNQSYSGGRNGSYSGGSMGNRGYSAGSGRGMYSGGRPSGGSSGGHSSGGHSGGGGSGHGGGGGHGGRR